MKRHSIAILVVILISSCVYGRTYIDTLGGYKDISTSILFRETRVEIPLFDKVSLGLVNSVEDGLLLTGTISNWRGGAYLVANLTSGPSIPFSVFAGGSMSGSFAISTSISFDAGMRAKFNDFPLIPLVFLVEGEIFSDSANTLCFIGPSISLGFLIKDLSLDVGYSLSVFIPFLEGATQLNHGILGRLSIII